MNVPRTLRVLRAACLSAVALLALAAPSAAAPRWEQVTPFGGEIVALARSPSVPDVLYAASRKGPVFRSLDGGATWHRRTPGRPELSIADLVVDPRQAQTLYASTGGSALLRSRDGGSTWSQIDPEPQVSAFAADPGRPGALFAATRNRLHRSEDGGDSWTLTPFDGPFINGLAVDPHATDTVLALVDGNGTGEPPALWKSTDRGTTWTSVDLPELALFALVYPRFVFDPVRPGVLYVIFPDPYTSIPLMLRSTDGGASWSALPAPVVLRDLVILPEGTLLAATELGLGRSADGGATWEPPLIFGLPAGPPHDGLLRFLRSATAPGELLIAGRSGVWRSGDDGASWVLSNRGIRAQGASLVEVSPAGPPAVLAIAGPALFRSADQGGTWTRLQSWYDGPQPYLIEAFDPRHPQVIHGIGTNGVSGFPVASTNGGRQWARLPIPFSCDDQGSVCDVTVAAVALDRDGSLLAGGSYFFRFQGRGSFLLRSADGGHTWQALTPIEGLGDLAVDPRRRGTYHAVSCAGLFRSTDAGASWKPAGRGLPGNLCIGDGRKPVLAIDPRDPRRFYVGTVGHGVFASTDGGATFRAMSRGLADAVVVTLRIDPTDSAKIHAGVALRGVFQWNAEQRRWTPLNRGLPLELFQGAIALDPRNPSLLYAASPVDGVFRLDLEDSEESTAPGLWTLPSRETASSSSP